MKSKKIPQLLLSKSIFRNQTIREKKSIQKNFQAKNGMLYYTERTLPNQTGSIVIRMTNVMKDLQQTSFFVPLVEKYSPLSYSIVQSVLP